MPSCHAGTWPFLQFWTTSRWHFHQWAELLISVLLETCSRERNVLPGIHACCCYQFLHLLLQVFVSGLFKEACCSQPSAVVAVGGCCLSCSGGSLFIPADPQWHCMAVWSPGWKPCLLYSLDIPWKRDEAEEIKIACVLIAQLLLSRKLVPHRMDLRRNI